MLVPAQATFASVPVLRPPTLDSTCWVCLVTEGQATIALNVGLIPIETLNDCDREKSQRLFAGLSDGCSGAER